jgi:hypothetical protein
MSDERLLTEEEWDKQIEHETKEAFCKECSTKDAHCDKFPCQYVDGYIEGAQSQATKTANYFNTVVIPAAIEKATGRTPDMTKDSNEFWKDIIYKEGKLDEEQVLKELADFYFMIDQVPKVYCAITGSQLSKPLYFADTVITKFEDWLQDNYIDKDDVKFEVDAAVKEAGRKLIDLIMVEYGDPDLNAWLLKLKTSRGIV